MVTRQEAIDMRLALEELAQFEQQQAQTQFDVDLQVALDWWDTVKPAIPTTRQEALDAYRFIEDLLKTETDRFRLIVLRKKLEEANEKFKERKRNG